VAVPGNEKNEIHHIWGMGIKGRINVGLVLIRIRSVFGIAYTSKVKAFKSEVSL
jgi:hypothetical protein